MTHSTKTLVVLLVVASMANDAKADLILTDGNILDGQVAVQGPNGFSMPNNIFYSTSSTKNQNISSINYIKNDLYSNGTYIEVGSTDAGSSDVSPSTQMFNNLNVKISSTAFNSNTYNGDNVPSLAISSGAQIAYTGGFFVPSTTRLIVNVDAALSGSGPDGMRSESAVFRLGDTDNNDYINIDITDDGKAQPFSTDFVLAPGNYRFAGIATTIMEANQSSSTSSVSLAFSITTASIPEPSCLALVITGAMLAIIRYSKKSGII